ncbi:glycosyltransferase [Halovenus sp. WSH3]|uniref:Glycosyltransferase n=1 Tax=Halovenus carboxidivorans TaxID=2692199 RepID=A0A6B0TET9_9EURY|nr:glycosyltransferase [Halovenus carboxidivorans]
MRVGFFTDSYFPEIDGVTYTLQLWCDRLSERGHETDIIYPDGDYEPGEGEHPVPSLPNPFYPGYRAPTYRRPSTLPDLDLVHCHGPGPVGWLGLRYAQKYDVPLVYTHHTPIEEYFHQGLPWERLASALQKRYPAIESKYMQLFDVVTASTSRINRDVDHVQLPVGVNMEFFQPTEQRWYEDETVIGYSGRLSSEKNLAEVLEVARELPEYQFVIVGEGPRREALRANKPDNVTLRDFLPREELPIFYSSIDVFITASTADTLGLSTLEANACGTPVVAADAPPFDRTIGVNNGRRYEPGNVEAATQAVEECLRTDRDTRGAVEQYSVDRTIDQLETLYEGLRDGRVEEVELD